MANLYITEYTDVILAGGSDSADWYKRHITAGQDLDTWKGLAPSGDVYEDDDSAYGEDLTLPELPVTGKQKYHRPFMGSVGRMM